MKFMINLNKKNKKKKKELKNIMNNKNNNSNRATINNMHKNMFSSFKLKEIKRKKKIMITRKKMYRIIIYLRNYILIGI